MSGTGGQQAGCADSVHESCVSQDNLLTLCKTVTYAGCSLIDRDRTAVQVQQLRRITEARRHAVPCSSAPSRWNDRRTQ